MSIPTTPGTLKSTLPPNRRPRMRWVSTIAIVYGVIVTIIALRTSVPDVNVASFSADGLKVAPGYTVVISARGNVRISKLADPPPPAGSVP